MCCHPHLPITITPPYPWPSPAKSEKSALYCDDITYVDDDSLTEVMVMRHWVEVVLARVLRILVDTLLFVTGDLRQ